MFQPCVSFLHKCSPDGLDSHRCYYLHFAQGEETEGGSASVHSVDHLHCLLHTLPHHTGEQKVHGGRDMAAVPPRRSECTIDMKSPVR